MNTDIFDIFWFDPAWKPVPLPVPVCIPTQECANEEKGLRSSVDELTLHLLADQFVYLFRVGLAL